MDELFLLLLVATSTIRGLGAGIIFGIVLLTFPVRKRLGLIPYTQFTKELYKGDEVKIYGAITVSGALLTLALTILAFIQNELILVRWSILFSLVATILGFVGTGGAFPAMQILGKTSDDDKHKISELLDRFTCWGTFSAFWHIIAFLALMFALIGLA